MVSWNFPSNAGGQVRGVEDSGIATFNGNELKALARETCQNSLDAKAVGQACVRVEFCRYIIDYTDVPGHEQYKQILNRANDFWKDNANVQPFFDKSIRSFKHKFYVLRVSDYYTTGLSQPYNAKSFGGWNALTKIDGGATKSGDAGGSYGIGKNAPFSNSTLRLVFYRTLNEDNEIAAQGMSRLVSFLDLNDSTVTTTGVGYYGNPENNMPVPQIPELDKLNERSQMGTDVFIYGFNDAQETWERQMFVEILDNFLIAIYKGKLEVSIQNETLNKDTLKKYIEKYKQDVLHAYDDYCALIDKKAKEFNLPFRALGIFHLKLLVDSERKLNRKILVVRNSGMTLFQMDHLPNGIFFTGVLELEGQKLNEYFRQMESPTHDGWDPGRHSNAQEAADSIKEIKRWVRNRILENNKVEETEQTDVKGLGDNLSAENDGNEHGDRESLTDNIDKFTISEKKPKSFHGTLIISQDVKDQTSSKRRRAKQKDNSGKPDTPGVITDNSNDNPATRTRKGRNSSGNGKSHTGTVNPEGHDLVNTPNSGTGIGLDTKDSFEGTPKPKKEEVVPLSSVRLIRRDDDQYKLIFRSPKNVKNGMITIQAVGENGKKASLIIDAAREITNCSGTRADSGRISFAKIKKDAKAQVAITLRDAREYTMEVIVYEYK